MPYIDNVRASVDNKKLVFADDNKGVSATVSLSVRLGTEVRNVDQYITPSFNKLIDKIKWGHSFTIPNNPLGQSIAANLNAVIIRIDCAEPLSSMGTACVGYWLPSPEVGPIECIKWDFGDIRSLFKQAPVVRKIRGVDRLVSDPAPITLEYDANGATITIEITNTTFTAGQVVELDPVTQTGSFLDFQASDYYNATGTFTSTLTVPSDAQIAIVGHVCFAGYGPNYPWSSDHDLLLTKGGSDTKMELLVDNATGTGQYSGLVWYMVSPDTGSNKSLKWDWYQTMDMTSRANICFWKGLDISSPPGSFVRDTDKHAASAVPWTTPTLTASSGDFILGLVHAYVTEGYTDGSTGTLTNCSVASQFNGYDDGSHNDGAWVSASPSGNQTIGVSTATHWDDGGIIGVVLKPSAGGGSSWLEKNFWWDSI